MLTQVSYCPINGNISTSARTKSAVSVSGWYRMVTRDKGEEVEEREEVQVAVALAVL